MQRLNLCLAICFLLFGCSFKSMPISEPQDSSAPSEQPGTAAPETPSEPEPAPTPTERELTPYSPQVVYAEGWNEIIVTANFAKTTIDVGAHFVTTRNACGKDAYGAIKLDLWNTISQCANTLVQSPPLNSENAYCVAPPTESQKYMDGSVEIKTSGGTRLLFEMRDGQICGTIKDSTISNKLLNALHEIVNTADIEECPHGWGS